MVWSVLCVLLVAVDTSWGEFSLTILHTNDVHSHIETFDKYGGTCTEEKDECYGGVARRYTQIETIRRKHDNVLLLDAGDQFQGTLWFNTYKGQAEKYFMQRMRYDAMTLGNHEFDLGTEILGDFLRNLSFPVLSCNLDASEDPHIKDQFNSSIILDVNGRKVGIIGIITPETAYIVSADAVKNLKFKNATTCVKKEVTSLKKADVQIIIVLSHQSFERDIKMAENIEDVDIIVGGHSHTLLYTGKPPVRDVVKGEYPYVVTQTSGRKVLIVHAGAHGKYLGFINTTFDDKGEILQWNGNPILLNENITEDSGVKIEVEEWKKGLWNLTHVILGETRVLLQGLNCYEGECNLGSFVLDVGVYQVLRMSAPKNDTWSDTPIMIMNSGGIRSSIKPGTITYMNINEAMPFVTSIERITLKGRHIWEIIEHSAKAYDGTAPRGGFLQFSGLRVRYAITQSPGQRVHDVAVLCHDCDVPTYTNLEMDGVYEILIPTFLVNGGDGYTMIQKNMLKRDRLDILLHDILMEHFRTRSPVVHGLDGRIHFLEPVETTPSTPSTPPPKQTCSAGHRLLQSTDKVPLLYILSLVIAGITSRGNFLFSCTSARP